MYTVRRETIGLGDAGTAVTVSRMRALIREGGADPMVRLLAQRIVAGVDGRDTARQAGVIRSWLKANFRFLRDPQNVELLHTPEYLLRMLVREGYIQGDCDDVAILGGALGEAIGLKAKIVTVGFDGPTGPFAHVWVELTGPGLGRWVELDTTRSRPDLASMIQRRKDTIV